MTRAISPVLEEVLQTGQVEKPTGEKLDLVANISVENSNALFDLITKVKPKTVIEIGMAYGVSTLTILSALNNNQTGRLISIDPYIGWPTAMAVARHQVTKAGFDGIHSHIHEASQIALPKLWEQVFQAELIYIDGYHNFEYVMADCFFADKLLGVGGVLGFNDCGWRAVFKVIKFLSRHRKYQEISVLEKTYQSRNLLFSFLRRLEGCCGNDRYFRKLEDWEPESGFFKAF